MDFSDREVSYPCLDIVENKQSSRAKIFILKAHLPMIGAFPLIRKLLHASHQPSPKVVVNRNKGRHGQLLWQSHN
uniref:Putative ovule protein n=1 Tax=Solanum chacoense TaxID=4108 RepID=A0A0V0GNT4_SOLCH